MSYIDKPSQLTVYNAVYGSIGYPPEYISLENARLSASEIVYVMKKPSSCTCDVSIGYTTKVLRDFREDVLREFFACYPSAIRLVDWHELARAVERFTTNLATGIAWNPQKMAVIDAVQKHAILSNVTEGIARFFKNNQLKLYKEGKCVEVVVVKPHSKQCVDANMSTIMRTTNGDLVYSHELR